MKYLTTYNGIWTVRIAIPARHRELFRDRNGRPMSYLTESTGERDAKRAERLALPIIARFKDQLEKAENGELYWTTHDIQKEAQTIKDLGGVYQFERGSGEYGLFDTEEQFRGVFRVICETKGITGAARDELLTVILKDGAVWREPTRGGGRGKLPEPPKPLSPDGLTLTGLRDQQVKARPMDRKAESEFKRAFAILQRITGDVDIRTITRAHLIEYKNTLENYPTHNREADKLSPQEIRETKWARTLNPASINKYLSFIRTAFTHAINDGRLEQNPADNVMVLAKPKTALYVDKREFELDELRTVMSGLQPDGADYWLPWIGLYTAARLGEITALTRSDLRQDHGVWYFRITDQGEDKSVKTERSVRDVPVHDHLIQLGFLDYARKQKGRLFPEAQSGKKLAQAYSKRFGRYLDRLNLSDPALSYHSLRHTWITAARFANVPDQIWKQLSAHQDQRDVGDTYGSNKRRMEILQGYINRIRWDGITPKRKRK